MSTLVNDEERIGAAHPSGAGGFASPLGVRADHASVRTEGRLIVSWARRELNSRYRQSALRLVWTLLQPVSVVLVYVMVFHWVLRVGGDGLPYLSFMAVGVVVWRYFAVGLAAATAFVEQAGVLSKVYFRREIVPLSICLAGAIDLAVGTALAVIIATIQGLPPRLTIVALPAVYIPLVLYTACAAVLLSTVTVFLRDLGHAMPTVQQLMFLATPIMYPASQLPPELTFLSLNPLAQLVEMARGVTLEGRWPGPALLVHVVVAAGCFALALAYLRSIEHRIVDVA